MANGNTTTTRRIMMGAKLLSSVFSPFYLPMAGLLALLIFSYFSVFPFVIKLRIMLIVLCFTVLLPSTLIRLYRNSQGWTHRELGIRERRMVPYIISIVCYFACHYYLFTIHIPHFIGGIVLTALILQMTCALINPWWKISTHTAAIGAFTGALMAFSLIFNFNPVWWLCILLMLSGLVGTSRMLLRQHTLAQVLGGYGIGFFVAFYSTLML